MTWSPEVHALADDWRATIGLPSYPRIARCVRHLAREFPFSQIQIHWKHYIAAHYNGRGQFASPEIFERSFLQWGSPTQSVVRVPYVSKYPTADEADAKAGIPLPEP
jgi:hypothetical protein